MQVSLKQRYAKKESTGERIMSYMVRLQQKTLDRVEGVTHHSAQRPENVDYHNLDHCRIPPLAQICRTACKDQFCSSTLGNGSPARHSEDTGDGDDTI
jgi:hypothetical protein